MLLRLCVAVLCGCALCGCRSTYSPGIAARYDEQRAHLEDWLFSNTVNPQCDGRDSPPATMATRPSGSYTSAHVEACGLVVNEVRSPAYKQNYVAKVCGGAADAACNDKYQRTFIARLAERYTAADLNAVSTRCTAHPIECGQMSTIELWAVESHNKAVRAQYDAMMRSAASDSQQEQATFEANARASNAAMWQAVADAFKPPPQIHCTSTTLGGITDTTCQ